MMNRRDILRSMLGTATLAFDLERALWVPGEKFISIPRPRRPHSYVTDVWLLEPDLLYHSHDAIRDCTQLELVAISGEGHHRHIKVGGFLYDGETVGFASRGTKVNVPCAIFTADLRRWTS